MINEGDVLAKVRNWIPLMATVIEFVTYLLS